MHFFCIFGEFFPPCQKRGFFRGLFRLFQHRIEEKKVRKKGVFRHFFFKFSCFFFVNPLPSSLVRQFTWGENLNFDQRKKKNFFFQKIFNFKKPKTLRKICVTFLTTRNFYPYRPLVAQGGVSFPYVFSVQNPLLKIAPKKKSESFCSTII